MSRQSGDSLTIAELIQLELQGKNVALGRYDTILWQIRSGYALILYGALGLLFKNGLQLETLSTPIVLLVWGFSILAYSIDFSFRVRQLRVVRAYNLLADQALSLSLGDSVDSGQLRELLHLSGESRMELDKGVVFRAALCILLFYVMTPVFASFLRFYFR